MKVKKELELGVIKNNRETELRNEVLKLINDGQTRQ